MAKNAIVDSSGNETRLVKRSVEAKSSAVLCKRMLILCNLCMGWLLSLSIKSAKNYISFSKSKNKLKR